MRRPMASAGEYPKSRSAPGFHPTTVPSRSMVTIATGLVSTSASEYCFWRWISRKSPALWMASTDCGREGLKGGDDLGREGAPLPPQDHEPTEQPFLPDEGQREERAHAFPVEEALAPGARRAATRPAMSATWTGSRITPARPIAPSPSPMGAARRASTCSGETWCVARCMEALGGLVELVDDPWSLPDSWTARLTMVSSTVSRSSVEPTAWLTSPSARSSPTERVSSLRPRLQLLEQPDVLDRDHRLVGEGLEERDLSLA